MRRVDTGWRDGALKARHAFWRHAFPVAGMDFPMVEYDRGEAVAVISYTRRGETLPSGKDEAAAHRAFGRLHRRTGEQLPFLTVQYDPRNWAYRLFPHNGPAREFLSAATWAPMTEAEYASALYRLRGRHAPVLAPYGVDFSTDPWIATEPSPDFRVEERWHHQFMSTRRRCFEPVGRTRPTWRNPCLDIDLAVIDQDDQVALLVDYKAPGAKVNTESTNMQALGDLWGNRSGGTVLQVPAMLVTYEARRPEWVMQVHCLNAPARHHLAFVMGHWSGMSDDMDKLAEVVAGQDPWVELTEREWMQVLNSARDL